MVEQHTKTPEEEPVQPDDTFFDHHKEEEPNDNTKMVT